jgi:hypothetical protein
MRSGGGGRQGEGETERRGEGEMCEEEKEL